MYFSMFRAICRTQLSTASHSIFTFSYDGHPWTTSVLLERAHVVEIGREYCNKFQEWCAELIALLQETSGWYSTWMAARGTGDMIWIWTSHSWFNKTTTMSFSILMYITSIFMSRFAYRRTYVCGQSASMKWNVSDCCVAGVSGIMTDMNASLADQKIWYEQRNLHQWTVTWYYWIFTYM